MENCIFCKIIKKEIPANIVYEDDKSLSFIDIRPVSDGHLLIIPRVHTPWMQEADDEIVSGIFKLAKKLMLGLKKSLSCDFMEVVVVGEEIPHFHVHLIPRYFNDGLPRFKTKTYKEGEANEIAQKIIAAL